LAWWKSRACYAPQTNLVLTDGTKGGLLPVLRAQGASTLEVVSRIRATVPAVQATLPRGFDIKQLFDQSVFVRGAIDGVLREAMIAAGLTGLMMLLFLGSWRSTLIVLVSIPLSLLVSMIALGWLGQTLNLMTLGGMALAVGILVDDATVEVENFHRQRRVTRAFAAASNRKQEDFMDMEDGHDEAAGFFIEIDVRSGRGAFGIDPGAGGAKGLCVWGRSTQ
jgi:multidrug efflux pump subunit AcrB